MLYLTGILTIAALIYLDLRDDQTREILIA